MVQALDGINFGHQGGFQSEPLLSKGLRELYALGFKHYRIPIPVYTTETSNTTLRDNLTNMVETIMEIGSDTTVVTGYTVNGASNLTSTTYTTFENNLLTLTSRMHDLNYPGRIYVSTGNEDDPRVDGVTITTATFQGNIRTLCDTIHSTYNRVKVVYSMTTNHSATWLASPGNFDALGLQPYSGRHTFHSQLLSWKKGLSNRAWLTEWNASDLGATDTPDPTNLEKEIFSRRNRALELGVRQYLFYFDGSSGSGQQWAMKLNDEITYRKAWGVYTNKRNYLVDNYVYPTISGE